MKKGWLLLLLSTLFACSTDGTPVANSASDAPDEAPIIVWPPPPEQARIEYLQQFNNPEDLGLHRPFGHKLRKWLAGGDDPRMSRPYAIAGSQDLLVVADPDAALLHVFNIKDKTYRIVSKVGKQKLRSPIGVALGNGQIFIADSVLKRVYILDRKLKLRQTIAGFDRPTSLAFAKQNQRLYVADTSAHEIRVFDLEGKAVQTIGGRGEQEGKFNFPSHLAISGGKLLVNDTMNFRIQVLDLDGRQLTTFGKHGVATGAFAQSKGVAMDTDGHIYVADVRMNMVQVFSPEGDLLLAFGSGGNAPGTFDMPAGLAFVDNTLYVADSLNRRIQVFRYLPEGTVK